MKKRLNSTERKPRSKLLRTASVTAGVLIVLMSSVLCLHVPEKQGIEVALMPFVLIVLAVAVLQVLQGCKPSQGRSRSG
ncbi:hypothetical protein [Cohnella nanjingensis]|uniref:Uncharacterized protein n=1 Tax=Cohnella nanjingensis TaxID=1387779 RepID=A0A7X0RU17_9BACL|nr:hypothetical protein [Cohnella nanjingensis]MBB6673528.1 hypothetical protein [Cohnella nanjingensis]